MPLVYNLALPCTVFTLSPTCLYYYHQGQIHVLNLTTLQTTPLGSLRTRVTKLLWFRKGLLVITSRDTVMLDLVSGAPKWGHSHSNSWFRTLYALFRSTPDGYAQVDLETGMELGRKTCKWWHAFDEGILHEFDPSDLDGQNHGGWHWVDAHGKPDSPMPFYSPKLFIRNASVRLMVRVYSTEVIQFWDWSRRPKRTWSVRVKDQDLSWYDRTEFGTYRMVGSQDLIIPLKNAIEVRIEAAPHVYLRHLGIACGYFSAGVKEGTLRVYDHRTIRPMMVMIALWPIMPLDLLTLVCEYG